MGKNTIGIDISDFSIEALSLEKSRGGFKVEAYSRFRLSPDIVEDGRVLDKEKLKEAILKLFQNAKPQAYDKSRKVFLSIPESRTFSKVLTIPANIKDKELTSVAVNEAEEVIPESIDKLTSVVKLISKSGDKKQVFYTGAETEVLRDFVAVFSELDIDIEGITTESISSFYGFKRDAKVKKNILVLDLGARTTIASVFNSDGLCSSININIAGDKITEAIAKKMNITHQQAEDKKRQVGLSSDESGEIMLISQGQLQPLIDELKVFIKYWQESNNGLIEEVVLIGGLSQMHGIDKYFGDNLNLSTNLGEPFIDKKSFPAEVNFSKYINVLGLARIAHEDIDIDFYEKLPKDSRKSLFKEGGAQDKTKINRERKNILTEFFTKLKNISKIFRSKYFWVALAVLFLAAGVYVFRDRLWPEPPPLVLEETIVVAIAGSLEAENFVAGELYDFRALKKYNTSEDEDLPEDYVDNFANSLDRLMAEANQKIPLVVNDHLPEGSYVLPQVLSYELLNTNPTEENYVPGEELTANIDYIFMAIIDASVKEWLVNRHPNLENKINSLNYEIVQYNDLEEGDNFVVRVHVNK